MLDTKMIIYEGNVIEMFLKSVLQFSLSNKSILLYYNRMDMGN